MNSLVGYTGFVGSNLAEAYAFDAQYNSRNIDTAYKTNPDLLIYAGLRAEKYLANKDANADFKTIEEAINNIKAINPRKLVLISTVDVYPTPYQVNEDTFIETKDLQPYGFNRYYLEKWVKENIKEYLIVRLPGLYGKNLKKNFIYDMIHIIPTMLNEIKYNELSPNSSIIKQYYKREPNGFYKCIELAEAERQRLKNEFLASGFSALNFTDSRGLFQYYNLTYLWQHIEIALKNNIEVLNLAVEPVTVSELYQYINRREFSNEVAANVPQYDFKTNYADIFQGENGYLFAKEFVLEDIKRFVEGQS